MAPEKSELGRNIGFHESMTPGGDSMIGAGIFILPRVPLTKRSLFNVPDIAIADFAIPLTPHFFSELTNGIIFTDLLRFEIIVRIARKIKETIHKHLILKNKPVLS